ncbi:hypothetical protein Tco_0539750 [Tanacetum coccineum]
MLQTGQDECTASSSHGIWRRCEVGEEMRLDQIKDIIQFPHPLKHREFQTSRKPDLTFIDEIVESENLDVTTVVTPSNDKTIKNTSVSNTVESNAVRMNKIGAPIIEDWNSNDESEIDYTVRPSTEKIKSVKTVRETDAPKQNKHHPRGNQRNWNNLMSQRLEGPLSIVVDQENLNLGKFQTVYLELQGKGERERRTPAPTEPSGHEESSSLYAELGLTNSETESDDDVSPKINPESTRKKSRQQNPRGLMIPGGNEFGQTKNGSSRLYKLENLDIPHQVSKAVDEIVTDAVDWAIQAPLRDRFRDLPEADMKEILHHRMWETNSYKAHEDHKKLYEALEKSMDRDYSDQLLTDLAEARRKKKKRHDSPKTPPGSPPHQPPPPPPPAGPFGTSGASGTSGSSQLPPPPPPLSNQPCDSDSICIDPVSA